jgi:nicotinate-nucleotide--dimethylbenzimidazole phosphoribosyltransferase
MTTPELDMLARIRVPDPAVEAAAREILDRKTKPRGSLGRLEDLACRIAAIRGTTTPGAPVAAIVLAAGDHGIAAEGVSAYPQEVTGQMLLNFAAGGAAICVLARQAGARLLVVDAGIATPVDHPDVRDLRIGAGTRNATYEPAMTRAEVLAAIEAGVTVADELAAEGVTLIGLGEMGIANSTSAAALCAALLPAEPADVCGRGTGVDDDGLARKVDAVARALVANPVDPGDPLGTLAAFGGFETALLAGVTLGAAVSGVPVVLDGFITGAAALAAARIAPDVRESLIASHRSPEPGHALVLNDLGLRPLLSLDMRLGEGSGAALAIPLVRSAVAILEEMATFDQAGVTDAGA